MSQEEIDERDDEQTENPTGGAPEGDDGDEPIDDGCGK